MVKRVLVFSISMLCSFSSIAQQLKKSGHLAIFQDSRLKVIFDSRTGLVNWLFNNGITLNNTVGYLIDTKAGFVSTADFANHSIRITAVRDSLGKGVKLTLVHKDEKHPFLLKQFITIYEDRSCILVSLIAESSAYRSYILETRDISPLAVLPRFKGSFYMPGKEPRLLDVPFDNDDWVNVVERSWGKSAAPTNAGTSYELTAVYDNANNSGIVIGSVKHDFWKTGICYRIKNQTGYIDSLNVFGGVSTPDNATLPADYGGLDGTHDLVQHGTMTGNHVTSPLIYLSCQRSLQDALVGFGDLNARINGRRTWDKAAPVYWNSFGVEGVLGSEGIMMPAAVKQISDFLHSLKNFNTYSKPVLSIDSYDQKIYSTDVLQNISLYASGNGQQMGFYFIPFAMWSWKDDIKGRKVPGSDYLLEDVLLRDNEGKPIMYKEGKWGAYAMDPTHPAIRLYIIQQLEKAKAVSAKFIKIDFLTAGALESTRRYDQKIRTGIQAYNYGMKLLRSLTDSIMGKDIFITQAISPMFPSQYAHTRFISTDVYSHLRNDEPGFPHWGSTEASLATGSHMGWVQGTLWPFTNLDVSIMRKFQRNPDLSEQEIKVRLYAMAVMGSIYGDGSDYRDSTAAKRARKFMDNRQLMEMFSHPKAFIPIKSADGESLDQQLCFYLPGDTVKVALFNFNKKRNFKEVLSRQQLQLKRGKEYTIYDYLNGSVVKKVNRTDQQIELNIPPSDALLVKIIADNQSLSN
jgi:alpha-galactosidase